MSYRSLGAVASSIASLPTRGGTIRSKSGYAYRVTPDDLLWLARSTQAEGGTSPAATIWTYAQRQVAANRSSSLASLVRAHSQPMNPEWTDASTEHCRANPSFCTPELLARRRAFQSKPWADIVAGVRDKVVRWSQAALPNPVPKSVDFAAPPTARAYLARNPGSYTVLDAGNWYVANAASARWPANFVTMEYDGRVTGSGTTGALVAGAAIVSAAAIFAIWAWRRRQRR